MAKRTLHVKKGDKVVVISGADKSDKVRDVLQVFVASNQVLIKDVNLRWKHLRKSQQNPQGGRVRKEFPVHASKVLLYSEKAGKGVRTGKTVVDGKRIRVGKPCGTHFE